MPGPLEGVHVLVVEDRSAIAIALCDAVEDSGGVVVGPAARVSQTQRLIDEAHIDVAVLDVDLDGDPSFPAAIALHERSVPVILLTGYAREVIPEDLAGVEMLQKPVDLPELVQKLASLVAA